MQKDLQYYSEVHIFNDIYTFISISVFFRKLNFTLFLVGSTFWKASRLSEGKKKPKQSSDWIKELTLILPLSRKYVVFDSLCWLLLSEDSQGCHIRQFYEAEIFLIEIFCWNWLWAVQGPWNWHLQVPIRLTHSFHIWSLNE